MNRVVNDLVEAARVGAGRLELTLAPCDLAALVREVVEAQRETAPTRVIQLYAPAGPVAAQVDADRLAQVVTNYVTNALKYSPEDRPVEVMLRVSATEAQIAVRDQGPGLSPAQQRHLWQRGYRAPGIVARSGYGGNLGLGLYVSKTLVEAQGGRVGIESAPGRGSTFWCCVPLARGAAPTP